MSRPVAVVARERESSLWIALARRYGPTTAVAVAVAWLAYDGGTFALTTRNTVAIGVWWTVIVALALALWPVATPTRAALATAVLLTGLAGWTLASASWAASAEDAFSELDRSLLYVGVFLVAVLAFRRGDAGRVADGLALGIVAIAVIALGSRLYPSTFPNDHALDFLPAAQRRLSFPLDYWNGLGIFTALAFPLLLRVALTAERNVIRGVALAPLPALAGVIYLTSSRGGIVTALAGTLSFILLTRVRVAAVAATTLVALGAAAVVSVLHGRPELVNFPGSSAAIEQGRSAGPLIALICVLTGAAYLVLARFGTPALRRGPRFERAVALALVALVAAGVLASHPVRRFETFKQAPPDLTKPPPPSERSTQGHILSGSGTGRWQQWAAAYQEFKSRPLIGRGAGSYETWWAQHGSLRGFVSDAHSLYFETLGELGLVGFSLIVGALGVGLAAGWRRLTRARGDARTTVAALGASFVAYLLGAGVDWMWEMTVVSVVGIILLGLLTGPATLPVSTEKVPRARGGWRIAAIATALTGVAVLYVEAVPLFVDLRLRDSQAAIRRGNADGALSAAVDARNVEPWASSPYLQLALVAEGAGRLHPALGWIERAIDRDRANWRLWLVRARIETKQGSFAAASRSLRHAAALNPKSELFAPLAGKRVTLR